MTDLGTDDDEHGIALRRRSSRHCIGDLDQSSPSTDREQRGAM
jgi:hypothetical protein